MYSLALYLLSIFKPNPNNGDIFLLLNFVFFGGLLFDKLFTDQFNDRHLFAKWYPINPVPPDIKIFFFFNFI